ncbi:hypothetical protein [Micromonospora sp. MH99]|uniref:hypothetical protein n=1 Tax=Micromonospora sp. MH99 TaxID=1945510 RepID=UPI001F394554|nr:hypothetical protein [Micromonospora sp. MH99]MCF0091251.1 hypothetical protein [Micromonospora sp. MH99]
MADRVEIGLVTATDHAAIVLVGLPVSVLVRRFALRRPQANMDLVRRAGEVEVTVE